MLVKSVATCSGRFFGVFDMVTLEGQIPFSLRLESRGRLFVVSDFLCSPSNNAGKSSGILHSQTVKLLSCVTIPTFGLNASSMNTAQKNVHANPLNDYA